MKKIITAIITIGLLSYNVSVITANAANENYNFTSVEAESDIITSAGLISRYSLTLSVSGTTLNVSAKTFSNSTMKKIGIKDIEIQRSSDGSNWSTVSSPDDMFNYDSAEFKTSFSQSENSGYYYRAVCTHYAKEYGIFGDSQSISNTSNTVWL